MSILINGDPVRLDNSERHVGNFLDRFFSLESLRVFSPPQHLLSNRYESRSGYTASTGMPMPNYPPEPPMRINTLYWPTGAARWAKAYVLVNKKQANTVWSESESGSQPVDFTMIDRAQSVTIETEMYPLSPRPISADNTDDVLYLLPLVDQRYWWHFRNTADLVIDKDTTWSDLLTKLGDALDIEILGDTADPNYLIPDLDEFTRRYENIPIMLDAMAHSIGQRVVRALNGKVFMDDWSTAEGDLEEVFSTVSGESKLLAGAPIVGPTAFPSLVPEQVLVTFPKYDEGYVGPLSTVDSPLPTGQLHQETKDSSSYTEDAAMIGSVKVIHSTCFAKFTVGMEDPANLTKLGALAGQIARDYYASLKFSYDITFAGLAEWTGCGYDNYVEWSFGGVNKFGEYEANTRVQSMPHNFGVEEMLQQQDDLPVYQHPMWVKLKEVLNQGGTAKAYVTKGGDSLTATTNVVTVQDHAMLQAGESLPIDAFVLVDRINDKWSGINFQNCPS